MESTMWLEGRGEGVTQVAVEHPQVLAQLLSCSAQCWQLWPEAGRSPDPSCSPPSGSGTLNGVGFFPGSHYTSMCFPSVPASLLLPQLLSQILAVVQSQSPHLVRSYLGAPSLGIQSSHSECL